MFFTPGQDVGTQEQGACAGGMDQAGKCPAFPSPRKQENNGLYDEELGTQKTDRQKYLVEKTHGPRGALHIHMARAHRFSLVYHFPHFLG